MELTQLNPFIRYAREHKWLQRKTEYSRCYDCRLFFIHAGNWEIIANGEKYTFAEDTVIFLPPGTTYRISHKRDCSSLSFLVFNFDLIDNYAYLKDPLGSVDEKDYIEDLSPQYELPNEFSQVIVQSRPSLFTSLYECTNSFLTKTPYYRERCSAIIKICLLELLQAYGNEKSTKIIKNIIDYIHLNYWDVNLSNEQLSKEFGYSQNYLIQFFKEKTGCPPHAYLLQHRIRVAKNYLVTTNLDVNTISWKCGFNSCAYFIKQFKKHVGVTPIAFRKSQIKQFL